jgi:hypothetical protein
MDLSTIMMIAHYCEFGEDLTQSSIFVHLLKKLFIEDGETLSPDMSESYQMDLIFDHVTSRIRKIKTP